MAGAFKVLVGAADALREPVATRARLRPGDSPGWFAWLFRAGALPLLHAADPTGRARDTSFTELKGFALGGSFAEVEGVAQAWYKDDPQIRDRLFSGILHPSAKSHPKEVISPAGRGDYTPPHRAVLASEALSMGDLLDPAWDGDEAPARLDLAITIYVHLIDPRGEAAGKLARHLGSDRGGEDEVKGQGDEQAALLGRILELAIERLDRPVQADRDRVLTQLNPLAVHLEACRTAGGVTERSRPLLALGQRVRAAVMSALGDLPDRPRPGGLGDADQNALRRFVDTLRLSLRLGRLVGRA